jgi:hypothetical protein
MIIYIEHANIERFKLTNIDEKILEDLKVTLKKRDSYLQLTKENGGDMILPYLFLQQCIITVTND